jgi:hypothetical protein
MTHSGDDATANNVLRIKEFAGASERARTSIGRQGSRPTAVGDIKPVDGAVHAERTAIEHVRVDHRRADVRVPEQLLHGSDVVAILEQVCCE